MGKAEASSWLVASSLEFLDNKQINKNILNLTLVELEELEQKKERGACRPPIFVVFY
jgi:hypothetical protein